MHELFPPDGESPLPPELADVISQAVLQKMLLLADLKRHEEAIAAANDFLEKIPDAFATDQGLAVLAARMKSETDSGNTSAASDTARLLVEKDPHGPWGARGQDLLGGVLAGGGSASLDQRSVLKIAESQLAKKDYEQALKLCRQVIGNLRSAGKDGDEAADAFWFMAYAYHYLGKLEIPIGLGAIATALDEGLAILDNPGYGRFWLGDAIAIALGWLLLVSVILYPPLQLVAFALGILFFGGKSLFRLVLGPPSARPSIDATVRDRLYSAA